MNVAVIELDSEANGGMLDSSCNEGSGKVGWVECSLILGREGEAGYCITIDPEMRLLIRITALRDGVTLAEFHNTHEKVKSNLLWNYMPSNHGPFLKWSADR